MEGVTVCESTDFELLSKMAYESWHSAYDALLGAKQVDYMLDKFQSAAAMRERLFDSAERDVYRGSTSVGPHRDDVALVLDGSDVRVYGSQGQQRTVVLSLKLSVLETMKRLRGETPVLLLDDVFSELDRRRQRLLLEAVQGCQTFITSTHLEQIEAAGALRMQVYHVSGGNVVEV